MPEQRDLYAVWSDLRTAQGGYSQVIFHFEWLSERVGPKNLARSFVEVQLRGFGLWSWQGSNQGAA